MTNTDETPETEEPEQEETLQDHMDRYLDDCTPEQAGRYEWLHGGNH